MHGLLLFLLCAATVSGGQPDLLRQFQSFIESPPPIAELVFEQDQGDGKMWGLVRWQTNASLVRWAKDRDSFKGPYDPAVDLGIAGRLGNHHWTLLLNSGVGTTLMSWMDTGAPVDATNRVKAANEWAWSKAEHVPNLGVPCVGIGTIKWVGLSFTQHSDRDGITVKGQLVAGDSGQPTEMRIAVSHDRAVSGVPEVVRGRIAYSYGNPSLPAWMPDTIVREIVDPKTGRPRVVNRLIIHTLVLGSFPPAEFAPDAFLSGPVLTLTATNGKTIYQSGDLKGEVLGADDPRTRLAANRPKYRAVYRIFAVIFLLITAAVAARAATRLRKAGT